MSFKSKQRAKHGHLFGDDPLSASLVSTSDDPLFGPKKTTTTKSTSVAANDPLSQLMSNDSNPLETNSTPISPTSTRRKANGNLMTHSHSSSSSSHSGSIFGDIDVSKLGTGNGFSGSNKKVNNTSLRSSSTLKSSKLNLDEEEDLLFGGHRHSPSKSKLSQKSATTSSSPSPVLSSSPLQNNNPSVPSTPKKSPVLPAAPVQQPTNNIPKKIEQSIPPPAKEEPTKKEEPAKKEEKPTVSSSTSSFFKFFKSSNSKTSSSASSAASVNAPSPIIKNDDVTNNNNTTTPSTETPVTTTTPATTIPTTTNTPRETTIQPKQTNIYKNIKQIITKEKPKEEEEEQEDTRPQIILDEATRAFAEDDLFTSPKSSRYDFGNLAPEMDALTVNTDNKKLNASISTPTRVDDPWSEIPVSQNFTPEPSISSPLVVKVQDIEPQKRSAFADLIQSWNTGNSTNQEFKHDPDTFYDHIAEERRDIAFAGIEDTPRDNHTSSMVDWDVQEDNPWN